MMQVALIGSGCGMLVPSLRGQTILFWLLVPAVSAVIAFVVEKVKKRD